MSAPSPSGEGSRTRRVNDDTTSLGWRTNVARAHWNFELSLGYNDCTVAGACAAAARGPGGPGLGDQHG
eukprot:6298299-Pyramimonas_sp.AAC.1